MNIPDIWVSYWVCEYVNLIAMVISHMETDYKYYTMKITKDLLGDTVLICRYGSKHDRYANQQTIVIQSWEEGISIAQQRLKIRYHHGYKAEFLIPELA